jgi:hypothetical protein
LTNQSEEERPGQEEDDFFTSWVHSRLGKRKNFLIAIVGQTGSGKSYAAMKLGETFDFNQDFDINHVIFSIDEFYQAMTTMRNNCFIVFDEAGLGFSHREYQTQINKMLAMVFQTFRYKFLNVIFTMPKLGFLDYVGRSLLHGVIRMTDQGEGVIYRVQPNYLGSEIYTPKLGIAKFGLPSKALTEAYEAKKVSFLNQQYETFRMESRSQDAPKPYRRLPIKDLAEIVQKDRSQFESNGKLDAILISAELEIGLPKAYALKRYMETINP